jgi:hypothetical protein
LGPADSKIRARQWPRPVFKAQPPHQNAADFAQAQAAALQRKASSQTAGMEQS